MSLRRGSFKVVDSPVCDGIGMMELGWWNWDGGIGMMELG